MELANVAAMAHFLGLSTNSATRLITRESGGADTTRIPPRDPIKEPQPKPRIPSPVMITSSRI